MSKKLLHDILTSTWFSVITLVILIGILAFVAHSITKSYHIEPDFGGMVTIRQSEVDVSTSAEHIQLTQQMILEHITAKNNLLPVAAKYGWDKPYERMIKQIDVQQKITSPNSFVISVNTGNMKRSAKIAEALVLNFIESYRRKWEKINRKNLVLCQKEISNFEQEIKELQRARQSLRSTVKLNLVKNDLEMQAVNEQLISAQQQFFTAYTTYISSLADKYNETELELELASLNFTEKDSKIRQLKQTLSALKKRIDFFQKELIRQNPDVYSMKVKPVKLENMPMHVTFLYDNIQRLQQIKLAIMLPSIIQEKQQRLETEQRKKNTLEHLLNSRSCDVFIREIGR